MKSKLGKARCLAPFVRDDPLTIRCDRPAGHSGKHLSRWIGQDDGNLEVRHND